ncbi:MAG: hypothetical protein HC921_11505 [Synechococcaceae cyanobacterium SM2_3_1]|nr:hypothetical protein [Synechococcaceae cyanobacterium SM2_3_1]
MLLFESQLQGRQTRVIALSAKGFAHDHERVEAAGLDQFVVNDGTHKGMRLVIQIPISGQTTIV